MVRDALAREESCGCHLREESQTEDNEALRNDANFSHVSVWEFKGEARFRRCTRNSSSLKMSRRRNEAINNRATFIDNKIKPTSNVIMSTIDLKLVIWRQKNSDSLGDFEPYTLQGYFNRYVFSRDA